ncbi:hypothetical protein [Algoriphagus hitonicola]|uniref:Uncharacterized protein n=1 Tax=Algoriphagus hitonicola TaxID=435880 RepID=A0A1I2XEU4_9BACT|nr:hypothetical protein [Algoriphagus hitonicola]SFH11539.1 hypothetical protein SAMN04487988_11816 [Algoriphagus hitonicola]
MRTVTLTFIFGLFALLSCDKKNDPIPNPPDEGKSEIRINSIQLQDWTDGPKKVYENEWNLSIQKSGDNSPISFSFHPNNSPIQEKIELEKGSYSYSYESESTPTFSDFLPVKISGEFDAENPDQPVDLNGVAKSKRVFFQMNYESSTPKLEQPQIMDFYPQEGDFYLYYNTSDLLKIRIPFPESERFLTQFHAANSTSLSTTYRVEWPENNDFYENSIKLDENEWPVTLIPTTLNRLDESQDETSGLAWIEGRLFSINDGDNSNEIHEIDPFSGAVVRSIEVTNAANVDWEDLAQSENHLFIGDFGNNIGNRRDLVIYKVAISDLLNQAVLEAEKIEFNYPNQTDFGNNSMNHEFDCEAMVYLDGSLHLFTKNWVSESSDHYILPSDAGSYDAELLENIDLDGLVTAADIDPESGRLILMGFRRLGSNPLEQWLWFFEGIAENKVQGRFQQSKIGGIPARGFPEGLAFWEKGNIWISSERFVLEGVYDIPPLIGVVGLEGLF